MKLFYTILTNFLFATFAFGGSLSTPTNDDCTNAKTIVVGTTCNPDTGDVAGATQSLPSCKSGANADDDIWYKFTVGADTIIRIEVKSLALGDFDAVVELFDGCGGNSLQCVDTGTDEILEDTLTVGQTYYLRVYDHAAINSHTTEFEICIYALISTAPINDDCANATVLVPDTICVNTPGTVANATASYPNTGCSGDDDDDVWYIFTALDSIHTITVNGKGGFDPVIEVRDSCDASFPRDCGDNQNGNSETLVLTNLVIGNSYYVRVFHAGTGSSGDDNFDICIFNYTLPPANDECVNAISLVQGSVCATITADLNAATASGNPECVTNSANAEDDVWFEFTATSANVAVEVTPSASLDAVVEIFSSCGSSTAFACVDNNGGGLTEILKSTGLTVGGVYYVRVYDWDVLVPATTTFDICVYSIPAPPANDECSGAIAITASQNELSCTATTVNTINSTKSQPDASCTGISIDDDVWFKFVAVDTAMTIKGSNFVGGFSGFGVSLYQDSCSGTEVTGCSGQADGDSVRFGGLTIGGMYYLRTFTTGTDSVGTFNICVYGYKSNVGVAEDFTTLPITIFPNPVKDALTIETVGVLNSEMYIELLDVRGAVIKNRQALSPNSIIDMSTIDKGVYILKVYSDKLQAIKRVVKE
ncbi:MAG: T9SS type A sorting domain-containing protein [Bacteroidetes bacterium]|nr:T9SS type A sorting domain-containing protein [Bacteroidota bacterium]